MYPNDALTSGTQNNTNADVINTLLLAGSSTNPVTVLGISFASANPQATNVYCGTNAGGVGKPLFRTMSSSVTSDQKFMVETCGNGIYADVARQSFLRVVYVPYDVKNYNTSVYEYKLSSAFVLTRGTQDVIMLFGLSALIILLALKVFYLFFYKAVR